MSVGDVECRYGLEELRYAAVLVGVTDNPELVAEAVIRGEVVFGGRVGHDIVDNGVDLFIVGVCEEYGFEVGLLVADVLHAVLLLVGTCELVLLDRPGEVILEVAAHDYAVLRAPIHRLGIDVVVLVVVLTQPASLLPQAEVLDSLVIYFGRVLVDLIVEVDLGLDYVQQRALGGLIACLGRIEYVIGA